MRVATFEGVVENGKVQLPVSVRLPEKARVFVIVPDGEVIPAAFVGSPRLARPEQAADFKKEVVEEDLDADL